MKIKRCVGVLLYDDADRIFLMTSDKWASYTIPGGRIEKDESEVDALKREIMEELKIEINNIIKVGESIKMPGKDFFDEETSFEFSTFYAKASSKNIVTNNEIRSFGWFAEIDALKLNLLDSTRDSLEKFIREKNLFLIH